MFGEKNKEYGQLVAIPYMHSWDDSKCQVSLQEVFQSSLLIQAHSLFNVDEGQGYTNVVP